MTGIHQKWSFIGMLLPHQIIYFAAIIGVCGFTYWAGGGPERVGVLIQVIASIASMAIDAILADRWHATMPATFLVDLAACLAFMMLMLKTNRYWPIWAFGFSLAMIMAHLTRMLQRYVPAWSYYHTTGAWAYPVMVVVLIGAIGHRWGRSTAPS